MKKLTSAKSQGTEDRAECDHKYKCVYEGWDSETYECFKCGDRYKLYEDEMR
jgi:hypothetical protein